MTILVPVKVVSAAVVVVCDNTGRVLLTRRADHLRKFPGQWVFPGGLVENHESLEEGAAREVYEETGLAIPPDKLLRFGTPIFFDEYLVTVFITSTCETAFRLNEEVSCAGWFHINDRPPTINLTEQIIQQLLRRTEHERRS